MITYGSYLKKDNNVVAAGATIAFLDTVFALMAGMVIFTIVFRFGMKPSAGPGLLFVTLPQLFAQMPFGRFLAVIFFVLVVFAALTSAISLLEVVVAYFVDEWGVHRVAATLTSGIVITLLGLLSAISTLKVPFWKGGEAGWLDFFDQITSNYMLPIGGILISLFASVIVKKTRGETSV